MTKQMTIVVIGSLRAKLEFLKNYMRVTVEVGWSELASLVQRPFDISAIFSLVRVFIAPKGHSF